mmetsp:Transcript_29333/g.93890  ORF Transcript_29333/g.93890 Transcript_29333/m.93890 type:complete len:247 (+) Transcript_29333:512-1252(+)
MRGVAHERAASELRRGHVQEREDGVGHELQRGHLDMQQAPRAQDIVVRHRAGEAEAEGEYIGRLAVLDGDEAPAGSLQPLDGFNRHRVRLHDTVLDKLERAHLGCAASNLPLQGGALRSLYCRTLLRQVGGPHRGRPLHSPAPTTHLAGGALPRVKLPNRYLGPGARVPQVGSPAREGAQSKEPQYEGSRSGAQQRRPLRGLEPQIAAAPVAALEGIGSLLARGHGGQCGVLKRPKLHLNDSRVFL